MVGMVCSWRTRPDCMTRTRNAHSRKVPSETAMSRAMTRTMAQISMLTILRIHR
jgi:hypothetical protein